MSKDAVLKARGDVYDAALRMARAGKAVEEAVAALEAARLEYKEAGQALSALRSVADAEEGSAIAEQIKREVRPKPADLSGIAQQLKEPQVPEFIERANR